MSSTEDTKSPVEALKEAAEALERESRPLADADLDSLRRDVKRAAVLNEIADGLKRLSKGLRWIAEPLEWISKPLKRTAAALAKLTPADLAEAEEALSATAEALVTTARAVGGSLLDHGPMPVEYYRKLEKIGNVLPGHMYSIGHPPMNLISRTLNQTAEAVRIDDSSHLMAASDRLGAIAEAIEKAKADETAQKA